MLCEVPVNLSSETSQKKRKKSSKVGTLFAFPATDAISLLITNNSPKGEIITVDCCATLRYKSTNFSCFSKEISIILRQSNAAFSRCSLPSEQFQEFNVKLNFISISTPINYQELVVGKHNCEFSCVKETFSVLGVREVKFFLKKFYSSKTEEIKM